MELQPEVALTHRDAPSDGGIHAWLAAALFLAATLILFPAGGHDDSHITYWPAYALANFSQLVNYSGQAVEQSSTLLFVLTLAALSKVTLLPIPLLGRLCSLGFALASIFVVRRLAVAAGRPEAASVAPYFLATIAYFSFWATSGMETSLVALLYLLAAIEIPRALRSQRPLTLRTWLLIFLCVLVRPETTFVLLAVLLAVLVASFGLRDKASVRHALLLLGATLSAFGLVVAFRLTYFHQMFPQPVTAKAHPISMQSVQAGLQYLAGSIQTPGVNGIFPFLIPLTCLAGMFVWTTTKMLTASTGLDASRVVITGLVFAHLSFVVLVGADWMSGGRFLVPVLPLLAVMAAVAAGEERGFTPRAVLATVVCLQLGGFAAFGFSPQVRSLPLWQSGVVFSNVDTSRFDWFERTNWSNLRHLRSVPYFEEIVRRARETTPGKLHIWIAQAGLVPYYLSRAHYGRVEFVDFGGLTDRALTSCEFVAGRVPRGSFGLRLPELVSIPRGLIEQHCNLAAPDILYALGEPRHFRAFQSDMVIVYRQHERELADSQLVWSPSFIAVKKDVFLAIGSPPLMDVTFDDVILGKWGVASDKS